MTKLLNILVLVYLVLVPAYGQQAANNGSGSDELLGIDDQVQTLKKEVIQINHELSLLEEKLIFPSTTQVSVFISLETDKDFKLDSIQLQLGEQIVGKHIYTFRELEALQKGGAQRLYTGNIPVGSHKLLVSLKGSGAYEKSATFSVKKEIGPKFVELKLVGSGSKPDIKMQDW